MTLEQYLVWVPDLGEDADDGILIRSHDPECAARDRVERSYHDEPFDCAMLAVVKGPFGEITSWIVTPEPTIEFYSRQVKEPTP